MLSRESIFEQLAGDLEYHPRRALVYVVLAVAAFSLWYSSSPEKEFTTMPIVFGLGSLTLALKGIFLLRKSSEGLGMTQQEVNALSSAGKSKQLPALPALVAQIVQDFGAGSLLLWPLLNLGRESGAPWSEAYRPPIVLSGAVLFGLGWLLRRMTTAR
jgi:hypothetical protein